LVFLLASGLGCVLDWRCLLHYDAAVGGNRSLKVYICPASCRAICTLRGCEAVQHYMKIASVYTVLSSLCMFELLNGYYVLL
jgi:hypothetical protein